MATNKPQHAEYFLRTKVNALERAGRKDPIVRFDAQTNLPGFRTTQFRDINRTHSEFVKLAEHLSSAVPETYVPAVPVATTSAGAGTEEDDMRMKTMMQTWLDRVCEDLLLIRDEEVMFFIESDFGYSPVVQKKQPATGLRRKALKMQAPPPDESHELAEARPCVKSFYIATLDAASKLDKEVKTRKGLGLSESELGIKLGTMTNVETHSGLHNAFKKLGKTIQNAGDLHSTQATSEAASLGDQLSYHASDAFIVKETLTNRQILMKDLIAAEKNTRSKRSTADRMKGASNLKEDKVNEALTSHEEARNHEQYLNSKVSRVTGNLLLQQRKWVKSTTNDLRQAIRDYAIRQIESERRLLGTLETVRPDIRSIDPSGGLSRLGRDASVIQKSKAGLISQTAHGDAWSGVPRNSSSVVPVVEEHNNEPTVQHEREPSDDFDAKGAADRLATSTF